ncbi:MAG: RnfABCDGE type electron transport complex subunit [Herbinix sp.]|jgi:electron transport complex protein RnfG|nr:RnfABCDGE type electron transport complex subunit [Herbinix sp.]
MSEQQDNKNNGIFKIALNLTIACLISGCIIAGTYYITADTAVKANLKMRDETMKTMVEGSTSIKEIEEKDGWYEVYKDSDLLGYIIPSDTKGYGGTMELLVAVDKDLKIITYKIASSKETPGLGENASKEPFSRQFKGKTEEHLTVTKDPADTEDIQAISGATISSKAVTLGGKNAVDKLKVYLEGGQ